jgi:hypothetical protein
MEKPTTDACILKIKLSLSFLILVVVETKDVEGLRLLAALG